MNTISLSGLRAPASISIDTWGLAHIRAQNTPDAFFVQGLNAARDRLWQIDLWRKRGLGLLAADFGPGYLMQDRAARLFLYRGEMAPEWAAYGDDAKEICTAFAAGINAGVDLTRTGVWPLPPNLHTSAQHLQNGPPRTSCAFAPIVSPVTPFPNTPARRSMPLPMLRSTCCANP
ncbi:penicillin acylase family protein [Sulfitobacter sediminilitoris]|uniref:penicillin acylase family protein n=1 Tax=Sulfitobacter sediminilitoris TaxID=2698830 RepID=UPI003615554E